MKRQGLLFLAAFCITLSQTANYVKFEDNHSHNGHLYTNPNDLLYIHLVPHTHDDVGWLKTVDMYFSGANNTIQRAEVQFILDTTIDELLKDKNRKFTYVEMKFFTMWWKNQNEEVKSSVRGLVKEGRLEFINGGWSMHDEACPHYEDMINNMMKGHEFLMNEFGVKPRIGWQIDPFGHSNANARLFAEMGFDAVFFARADWQDKEKRKNDSSMEFLWRPFFEHLGKRSQILAHTMMGLYFPPDYYGFDTLDVDDVNGPFVDDPTLSTFNAEFRAKYFIDYVTEMRQHYRTNNLMIPMGGDFQFSNAHLNFDSIDKMIAYINKNYGTQVQLMYSTPGQYLDSLIASNTTWPVRYDDMFPYADSPEDYWTGYFTSRPDSKRQVRDGQAQFMASSKLYSLKAIDQSTTDDELQTLLKAKQTMLDAMGIYQHHDAITGTAKQHVANDYTLRLWKAMKNNTASYSSIISELTQQQSGIQSDQWSQCMVNNGTYLDCPIANNVNKSFMLTVHNPSLRSVDYQRIKVPKGGDYKASRWNETSKTFQEVNSTVFCHYYYFENGYQISDCDMHIQNTINGSSLAILSIEFSNSSTVTKPIVTDDADKLSKIGYFSEQEDGSQFKLYTDFGTYDLLFQHRYYKSNEGGDDYNASDNNPSGAYIFKPMKNETQSVPYNKLKGMEALSDTFVQDIWLQYSADDQVSKMSYLKVYAYQNSPVIEFEVLLDPLPSTEGGIELTVNFKQSDIQNNDTFYTDSNAMEMQKRTLNIRPDGTIPDTHYNSSSNYYPVNQGIAIKDENFQMTVMNDRSQGGSVLTNGRIEFMQNRRLFKDDGRGVGEPLSENGTFGNGNRVRATYYLHFFNRSVETSQQRFQQLLIDEPLQYFYSFNWTQEKVSQNSENSPWTFAQLIPMKSEADLALPIKIQMFPVDKNILFLRFENIGDIFDYATLNNTNVYIDVSAFAKDLYATVNGASAELHNINIFESTITGNQQLKDMISKKASFRGEDDAEIIEPVLPNDKAGFQISLTAQRIRSFYVEYIPLMDTTTEKFL